MALQTTPPPPPHCPICGDPGSPDAVFCEHCGKSVGEFAYVGETIRHPKGWHEALADRVTTFVSKPRFLLTHAAWFVLWVAINSGMIAIVHRFDAYPFNLLGILLAAEAILLTGFVLISQTRQDTYAEAASKLDYEVNVRTYRALLETQAALTQALDRLAAMESRLEQHLPDGFGNGAREIL
jgi:uncharacterized membrane protein